MINLINPAATIAFAQGIVYLLITLLTMLQPKTHMQTRRLLGIYSLLSAAWLASQLAWSQDWLPFLVRDFTGHIPLYWLLLLSIVFFAFTRSYLRLEGTAWGWYFLGFTWLGALVLVDSNLLTTADVVWRGWGWMLLRRDFVVGGIGLGWCLFMGATTFFTLRLYHRTHAPLKRNRLRYIGAAILLTFAGEAAFLALYWTLGGLLHLLGTLMAAYAVITVRLPSLRRALVRALSWLVTTSLALLYYTGVLLGTWAALQVTPAQNVRMVGLLLAAALAVLMHPLLNQAQHWLNAIIAGASHDPRLILSEYSQHISNILDLELLGRVVTELISDAMNAQRGWLFTVTHEKGPDGCNCFHLAPVRISDEENPTAVSIDEDSPLAEYFRRERMPLSQSEWERLPRFTNVPSEEQQWITALQMELFVPIHTKEDWIGLLALGAKYSGEPFWDDDQFLLSTLADQTAVALENARLVESLVRLNNDFRRAITALDQANQNLERLDRTKTEFISVASHELRTPLTLVSGYSQMLLEETSLVSQPQYSKMLNGISSGARRLHEVVESMLDMAKIDTRELQLDLQPVSIAPLIHGLHEEMKPNLQERSQRFEMQNLASLPAIHADQEALRKVFYHLLTNAIKYTPDGGKITVSGRALQPTPEALTESGVEIVVSDTGIGIDAGMLEVIFTKFSQTGELALHSTGKSKFKGAGPGLGLAIARGIVQAHFGRIWAKSPGHDETRCPGSQFYVFLPLYQTEKTRPRPLV